MAAGLLTIYTQLFTTDSGLRESLATTFRNIVDNDAGWQGALQIIRTDLFTADAAWHEPVLRMVGALVPMVPEGLVLMTSIAFAVGVIRLGRRQCLVNELPAIEGLARVDVVCADKTGTLTENGMRLSDLKGLGGIDRGRIDDALAALAADDARPNASMQAIAEAFGTPPGWRATASAPFKSATKWSGTSYGSTATG